MHGDDKNLADWRDLPAALGLLSRLPVRIDADYAQSRGAATAWAYPLVGAVLAIIMFATISLALWIGLNSAVAAMLALAASVLATGAMHEDGLADCADGFWGGYDAERRLEIMKDSQIGTYGVLALILSFALRWAALVALIEAGDVFSGILAVGMLSRAAMVYVMHDLPHARPGGLSASMGQPASSTTRLGVAVAIAVSLLFLGLAALVVAAVALVAAVILIQIAKSKISGQTGDVLGATQQMCEVACLLALASFVN